LISRGLAGLANGNAKYIAERLLPANIDGLGGSFAEQAARAVTGTIQKLDLYSMYGDVRADAEIDRARNAKFHRGMGFGLTPVNFTARSFSGEAQTAMEDLRDIQLGSTAEYDAKSLNIAAEMETLLLALERYLAGILQASGTWANSSPVTKWGAAGDDPMANILTGVDAVEAYGVDCTDLVIPRSAALKLRTSSGFRAYLPTDMDRSALTNDRVADILISNISGLKRVHFAGARYNSAARGQTPTLTDVWTDHVWMGHLSDNKGVATGTDKMNNIKLSPTAVQRVVVEDWVAEEYAENQTNSVVTQIRNRQAIVPVNTEIGYLLTDVVA
jgi:hypothetical protein